jgi:dTDP-4-dehydrorhamnose 3,5-epimerase
LNIIPTELAGVVIIEPKVFGDDRGYFVETWNRERYLAAGLPGAFAQDNISFSRRGVLRGLHFQNPHAQGKLVYVLEGEVFDVAVDIRQGSPTFAKWVGVTLSGENKRQFYIPPGYAHGYCVTGESAVFCYKCTDIYHPEAERTIRYNDPLLAIDWLVTQPIVSPRDQQAPRLCEMPAIYLPRRLEAAA